MTALPISDKNAKGPLSGLEQFLDRHVLPYPVQFLTNRIVILATLALLVPLIFFSTDQPVVNGLNSYLNVMSVVVSSTVLLYATIADVRDRAAARRQEEIAKDYQQVLEKRVQAEHVLNEKILELAAQISVQGMQVERLEKIRSKDRKQAQELATAYELVLEKRVQAEHELNEKILGQSVQNGIQNVLAENLEKLRTEDRDRAAELARAYEQVLEKRVQAQQEVLEKRVQAEHELNEKILAHAVENSIQNILVENLEKLRAEDREHVAKLARAQEKVLEKRVQAQEQVLEKRVQAEHELNEKILAHAVENSIQNVLVENLEKLRAEDREHAAELARAYEQVLEKRVQAQEKVLEKRVQAEHELNEKILQGTIENVLGERLKMVRIEDDTHAQQMHQEVMMSLQIYRAELAELAQLVQTLRPSSSGQSAGAES